MSTFSRSATSAALRSGRTLKPMMIAFDAVASSTSDSLMAPTPVWMIRILTLSSLSFVSVSASTSAEPCTSALMMIGSSLMSPSAICCCSDSSVRRPPLLAERLFLGLRLAVRDDLPRLDRIVDDLERVARRGQRRRPSTSTGVDGPAFLTLRPEVIESARTLPSTVPAMKRSPSLSVPSCTSTVATGPRPRSSLRLEDGALRRALRIGLQIREVRDEQDHLEQLIEILPLARGHFDRDRRAAPLFRHQPEIGQFALDALGIGVRPCRSC